MVFPLPLDALTVSQGAEEDNVHEPLAEMLMNWLPFTASTSEDLKVTVTTASGVTGLSFPPPLPLLLPLPPPQAAASNMVVASSAASSMFLAGFTAIQELQ